MRVTRDNGDYFEVTESISGAIVEFFQKQEDGSFERLIQLDFSDFEDAIKAIDSFDIVKDLIL